MPKNAVERLQKIENDLKTAISIYNVANKSNTENEKPGKNKKESEQHPRIETKARSNNLLGNGKYQSISTESVKRIASFIPRPIEDIQLTKVRNEKPGPAPCSSNMSSTSESDSGFRPERDFEDDSVKGTEWTGQLDPRVDYSVFISSSKVLEKANKVLCKNNYQRDEIGDNKKHPNKIVRIIDNYAVKNEEKEHNKTSSIKHTKDRFAHDNGEIEKNGTVRKKSTIIVKKTNSKALESKNRSKLLETNEDTSELSLTSHVIPNKIPRLEKRDKGPALEVSYRKSFTKTQGENKESKERQNRAWSCEKDLKKNKANNQRRRSSSEEVKSRSQSNTNNASTENTKRDEKSGSESTYDKFEQYFDAKQEISKTVEREDSNLEAQHLSKIIEKSNEKLQRMKLSKNLALDIAKQLKEKYEEVQLSNRELLGMLKRVEKDNEKLKYTVKDVTDSKMKLKLKMDEMRMDSKTTLLEQRLKTREVVDENIWLKTKMKDLEKRHSQEIMDKQKQIDRIQKNFRSGTYNSELQNVFQRMVFGTENQKTDVEGKEKRSRDNNKNEARKPEMGEKDDVRSLINEKSQLVKRVEQLESQLSAKQFKIKTLEGKVRDLEKELEKQTLQLKQKTERLENTNNELESIRRSSKDLEEQVKQLRLNIESFDLVHENLLKQSSSYENEIRCSEEEIRKLKEERARLGKELENEKDSLLIKNKIIEDQQETIRQLRERSEEYKSVLKRNESLERILNVEREEKLELQEAIERLKRRKDDLKKKIKSLENDLLVAPQEVVRDLQKTQMVLHELENQVQIKQKEWELHLKSLIREKEQACSVAEFATKKLMQTTTEFQKQTEAHKKLHRILAENLAAKEITDKITVQFEKTSENTPTTRTDTKGTIKCLQCCSSAYDGTFCTKPVWLPRRTMTSYYVQCPRKPENFP